MLKKRMVSSIHGTYVLWEYFSSLLTHLIFELRIYLEYTTHIHPHLKSTLELRVNKNNLNLFSCAKTDGFYFKF